MRVFKVKVILVIGHLSKTKSQVSNLRTDVPLVFSKRLLFLQQQTDVLIPSLYSHLKSTKMMYLFSCILSCEKHGILKTDVKKENEKRNDSEKNRHR